MRRGKPEERVIPPDIRYGSVTVQTMILHIMKRGKKSLAVRLMYDAMDLIKERTQKEPMEIFDGAIKNVSPAMEVRPRRAQTLAVRWLVEFARKRKEPTMAMRLANEILDAANRTGAAVKRREDVHKMAESNKAFAHYRW